MTKKVAKGGKNPQAGAEKKAKPRPAAAASPPEKETAKSAPPEAAAADAAAPAATEENGRGEGAAGKSGEPAKDPGEDESSPYPLREASEDPRWAVRTVWIWVGAALASIVFILTLLVLGAFHD